MGAALSGLGRAPAKLAVTVALALSALLAAYKLLLRPKPRLADKPPAPAPVAEPAAEPTPHTPQKGGRGRGRGKGSRDGGKGGKGGEWKCAECSGNNWASQLRCCYKCKAARPAADGPAGDAPAPDADGAGGAADDGSAGWKTKTNPQRNAWIKAQVASALHTHVHTVLFIRWHLVHNKCLLQNWEGRVRSAMLN